MRQLALKVRAVPAGKMEKTIDWLEHTRTRLHSGYGEKPSGGKKSTYFYKVGQNAGE